MERQRKIISGGISVGSSSILVIFVVLALTAFAALSLTTAGSDLRLTQRVARATQEYYAADAEAVELAGELRQAYESTRPEQFPARASELGWAVDGMFVSRSIPIEGDQSLEVTIDYSKDPLRFTRWQVVNSADWQEQDSFSLWGGEDINLSASPDGFPAQGDALPLTPPPLPGFAPEEGAIIGGADGATEIFTADPAGEAAGKE